MKNLVRKNSAALAVMIVVFILAASYGYYQFSKPRRAVSDSYTELHVDARTLFQEFTVNENLAGTKYLNKVIEVSGVVAEIDSSGGNKAILLSTGSAGYINCAMAGQIVNAMVKNDVRIKGKCAGYLMDVMMVDCVIQ